MLQIANEIIQGKRLTPADDTDFFLTTDLKELCDSADEIRRALCGNKMDLCTIVNGRSGRCSEDCKFCAQSCHNHTGVKEYPFQDVDFFVNDCKKIADSGLNRYSIVTSGKGLHGEEFQKCLKAFDTLHKTYHIELCASSGFETEEELEALKKVGVDTIHENLETSRRYFPEICTTHTYDEKVAQIQKAKKAGMRVCSGGIIGMGESFEDRLDMAFALADIGVYSIPINILQPIKGTPLEHAERLSEEMILRTVAMFRFINPDAFIRIAAGRNFFNDGGRKLFLSGANATITGDMLTTTGNNMQEDLVMLRELGFEC